MSNVRKSSIGKQVAALDWDAAAKELDKFGCAVVGPLLTSKDCKSLISCYDDESLYRSRVVMERHGYGRGEYRYYADPLPAIVADLRRELYPHLAHIANRWNESLALELRYPVDHEAFRKRCHAAGQTKPTPLILKYGPGDFNCLHQDVYGEHVFPLQVAFLLSEPSDDFTGGEFTLTEQRPRMQSRAEVVPLQRGLGVIFPVRERPIQGTRGTYRVNMRHGVSRIRGGQRFTLGIIFHDAK